MRKMRTSILSNSGRKLLFICGIVLAAFCAQTTGLAQEATKGRGFSPIGSYALSDIETINLVTGNLMFHLPIASLPPGRGGLSASLSLVYNSKLWDSDVVPGINGSGQPITYSALIESR